jgi:hypothetical protein
MLYVVPQTERFPGQLIQVIRHDLSFLFARWWIIDDCAVCLSSLTALHSSRASLFNRFFYGYFRTEDSKHTQTVAVVLSIQFYQDRSTGSSQPARVICRRGSLFSSYDDCLTLPCSKSTLETCRRPGNCFYRHNQKCWQYTKPFISFQGNQSYKKTRIKIMGVGGGECILLRKKIVKILHRVVHSLLH